MKLEATVYKSTGSWYKVRTEEGTFVKGRLAGRLKLDEEISSTNPIAVGDRVLIQPEEGQESALITGILDRKNYMVRAFSFKGVDRHILAANIDQALLVASLRNPFTSRGFIDRFLVTAAAYHIPVILVFNKSDLYRDKEWDKLKTAKEIYEEIGYQVSSLSATAPLPEELFHLLKGKTTLFAGHSGVGKSTILNELLPGLHLKTQPVSGWSGKGIHTTTFAEMFDLPGGGHVIDTPGVREWGLMDIEKPELSHYFLEMQPYVTACKFNNCLHLEEPGCAVKEAVAEGEIAFSRFESYLNILGSLDEK